MYYMKYKLQWYIFPYFKINLHVEPLQATDLKHLFLINYKELFLLINMPSRFWE